MANATIVGEFIIKATYFILLLFLFIGVLYRPSIKSSTMLILLIALGIYEYVSNYQMKLFKLLLI